FPASAVKYIHFPSGDQATSVQWASAGPTVCPAPAPLNATIPQGSQPLLSISASSTSWPSGGRAERGAQPPLGGGTYTSRSCMRLSSEVTMAMLVPDLISENRSCRGPTQVSPAALGSMSCGSPPSTGTE